MRGLFLLACRLVYVRMRSYVYASAAPACLDACPDRGP